MSASNIYETEPVEVFGFFGEIASVPHGSRNTAAISEYLVRFAKDRGLKYRQDDMGNVIIWKDGKGDKPVILQGHMDMVCEKEPGCKKDMAAEGLDLYIEGDELKAKGTTLGGDDGIAVAMALAILDGNDDSLPPIEAIFTVDEEIGMLGAAGIDVSDIRSRTMINIDSEEEGVFTVSCAGGVVANAGVDIEREATGVTGASQIYEVRVEGLTGGHSGIEIHKNRTNAIVMLGRLLQRLRDDAGIRIIDIEGGAKDNAIAVSAKAYISVLSDTEIQGAFDDMAASLKAEYITTDPDMTVTCDKVQSPEFLPDKAMSEKSTDAVIYMLTCLPNGIQRMSPDVEGLVQTSLNMGILKGTNESVTLTFCVRSSVASEKDMLKKRLSEAMKMAGGRVEFEGDYPGWQYRVESPLRDIMREVYISQYKDEPKIEAVHAGVECGFFADKLNGLDCVSIGPKLSEIHTYRESMNIPSVGRTYRLVIETLRRLAAEG